MTTTEYIITEEEKNSIKKLYTRKIALQELLSSLDKKSKIHKTLQADFEDLSELYNQWFRDFEKKYDAQATSDFSWNVLFEQRIVRLEKN